jgi:hypothetical protein
VDCLNEHQISNYEFSGMAAARRRGDFVAHDRQARLAFERLGIASSLSFFAMTIRFNQSFPDVLHAQRAHRSEAISSAGFRADRARAAPLDPQSGRLRG